MNKTNPKFGILNTKQTFMPQVAQRNMKMSLRGVPTHRDDEAIS